MSLKRNWVVRRCELVFVYSHERRQKKRVRTMRSVQHWLNASAAAWVTANTTKPRGVAFSLWVGGVLVPPVAEHPGEPFVQVAAAGSRGLAGVGTAFQEVDLGNSTPCRSNRVCPDIGHPVGERSVTNPDSKHLKDPHNGDLRVLKCVVDLHFGAEVHPVPVLLGCFLTGNMSTSNACLRKAEITQETISEGG